MDPDITTTASRTVYENRWMRVREDAIRRRDGSAGIYGVVDKRDFVVIAPVQDGVVHLVQQYRYPVQGRWWEFPQGTWDERPDADPAEAARGELAEETGLRAATMRHAGRMFTAYGTLNQGFHVFLATGLAAGPVAPDHEEQDLVTRAFPLADVERMIREGGITDSITVAAFGLLRPEEPAVSPVPGRPRRGRAVTWPRKRLAQEALGPGSAWPRKRLVIGWPAPTPRPSSVPGRGG